MKNIDIPIPSSEFDFITKLGSFNLIYPLEHPFAKRISVDMVVRALSIDDTAYLELLQNEKSPEEMIPVSAKLLEIRYIRETRLGSIVKSEWEQNYGPSDLESYLKLVRTASPDSYIKVIALKVPNYSLKSLNKKYGTIRSG